MNINHMCITIMTMNIASNVTRGPSWRGRRGRRARPRPRPPPRQSRRRGASARMYKFDVRKQQIALCVRNRRFETSIDTCIKCPKRLDMYARSDLKCVYSYPGSLCLLQCIKTHLNSIDFRNPPQNRRHGASACGRPWGLYIYIYIYI